MAKNKISYSRHLHLPRNKWENDSKKKKNIPQSSPMPLATPPKDDSEDNSGSEGETDSATDSETDAKMSTETPATLSLDKKNKKRQTEGNTTSVAEDDVKLAKPNSGASSTKAKMFERIWSEEDEILLLEGKINFAKDLGKDASENEFYDFVKDLLSIKNVGQISTKLRNLKRRFKGHDGIADRDSDRDREVVASTLDSEKKTESKASAGRILKPTQKFVAKLASQIINDQQRYAATPARMNMSRRRVYPLVSLNPYDGSWTVKVHVTNKGNMRTYKNARGEGCVFNVELTDEEGTQIQATMFNAAANKFYDRFQMGKVYYISRGSLKLANKQFKEVHNDYEMTLNKNSEVEELVMKKHLPLKQSLTLCPLMCWVNT